MSRTPKSELQTPFFVAAQDRIVQDDWPVPQELVASCYGKFCEALGTAPADLESKLAKAAQEFSMQRSTEPYIGQPGREKQILKLIADGGNLNDLLPALAPEVRIELAGFLREDLREWVIEPNEPLDAAGLARVRAAAHRFWSNYIPARGRKVDLALEMAVRALVELLEPALGHFPKVHHNKNNGKNGPTPACVGAQLISDLLRGIDTRLTTTSVMNMIARVRDNETPSQDPWDLLFDSNIINFIDGALVPDRQAVIDSLDWDERPL